MNRLSPHALGISIGILWSAYTVFCAITAMFGWGAALVDAISSLYIGYNAPISGALIGAAWGFLDGYIAGFVVAWIYNKVAK